MDAFPINPGHLLDIPKVHVPQLADLDPELGGEIFQVAMQMASRIRESVIRCEGVNLVLADGKKAGQEVFHVHLHVIPRFHDDNFSISSKTRRYPSRDELDDSAKKILATA
jgi:diadenosine tetraphosphate (Ap4A) HIT family hydrolase